MTRGRIADCNEATRELVEGELAQLGMARVHLEMARERVQFTILHGQHDILQPAVQDIDQANGLICNVQLSLRQRFEKESAHD